MVTFIHSRTLGFWIVLGAGAVFNTMAQTETAEHEHHHGMALDRDGMVMNENTERLPEDCGAISDEIEINVRVGRAHAIRGRTFGYDAHEWRVAPCSRITVTLINEDAVRHQWMVHGLPRYLYPQGMFHLEVNGGATKTGTFIVPSDDATYLVHCDISHHMEQGLKAQLDRRRQRRSTEHSGDHGVPHAG